MGNSLLQVIINAVIDGLIGVVGALAVAVLQEWLKERKRRLEKKKKDEEKPIVEQCSKRRTNIVYLPKRWKL